MKKKCLLFLLTALLISTSIFAQKNFIPLMVDYAFYKGNDTNNYLEFYLSLLQSNLTYKERDGDFRAEYVLTLYIINKDSILYQQTKRTESVIDSLAMIQPEKQFINIFKFEIPNEECQVKVIIQDLNSGSISEYLLEIPKRFFSPDSLIISDIELASHISKEVSNSEFNKNTLCILPNPSMTYTIINPLLYYYAEVYNLKYSQDFPGEYTVRNYISDVVGNVIKQFPDKSSKKAGESIVIVNGFNIVTLPQDIYYLNVEIVDHQSKQIAKKTKKFRLHKPGKIDIAGAEGGELSQDQKTQALLAYQNVTDKDLDQEFEMARYIASSEEIYIYKSLDTEAKKVFLYNFWNRRGKQHPELYQSYRSYYFDLVNLADNLFSAGQIQGWKTDRGRVILQHGKPDEWDRYLMEVDKKPYEIWLYHDIEGGVQFIFADLQGFGEFELIHSTLSGELHNPGWERLVHRAESSIGFDVEDEFRR